MYRCISSISIPIRLSAVLTAILITMSGCQSAGSNLPKIDDSSLRVLAFTATAWYRHPENPHLNGYLAALGRQHGIRIDISESANDINKKNLAQYDVLILCNTTDIGKTLDDEQKQALIDWYKSG